MKILFLTPWYPDEKSMHGVFVQEQARAIAELHEVLVVSVKIDYSKFGILRYTRREVKDGKVTEIRIRVHGSVRVFNQLNYFISNVYLTSRIAWQFKPDLVHGNIGYPGGLWSYLVSRVMRRPFVLTEHTFIYNNFRSLLHKRITLFSLARAAVLITVSSRAANEIRKYLATPVRVVPNIVRTEQFQITPFPEGVVTVGFMGNLSSPIHVKGLDILLRALSRITADFRLVIGGEGSRMPEYQAMADELGIGKRCFFFGFFPYDQGDKFMKQIHFYVNSSKHESFGIAVVESILSGRPVVSFDNGGPGDFVTSACGLLIEDQNESKLQEGIEWMIANYQTYDQQKMRAAVVSRFTTKAFQDRIEAVYHEALNGPL